MLTVASVTVDVVAAAVALHLNVVASLSVMVYCSVILPLVSSYASASVLTEVTPNKIKLVTEHTCSSYSAKIQTK